MKQSRKPKTPSIKQIMSNNGYPEGHIVRERCKHTPVPFNTLTDKDGTTYRWKAGEIPTEEDIVPTGDISPRTENTPPRTPPWTDNEVTGY